MCVGNTSLPKQAQQPEAPRMPDLSKSNVSDSQELKRRRRAGGTILTSPRGVTNPAQTQSKTLLGS